MKQIFTLVNSLKALCLVLVLMPSLVSGQVLAGWNTSTLPGGSNDFGTSPFMATTTGSNVTLTSLIRGSGVSTTGTGAARGFGGLGWNYTTAAAAVTGNAFFTFTIKASSCYELSLSAIAPFSYRRSSTGAATVQLQYSVNGGTFTDIGTALSLTTTTSGGATIASTSLSGISALQNLPSSSTVTIRIVPFGASAAGGTFYIFDVAVSTADDFAVTGSVASKPFYTAATSTNWTTTSTWSCGIVPTATDNVTIPSGATVVLNTSSTVNNITFTGGGKLTLGANDLTVNGTVTGDATAGYIVTDGMGKLTQSAVTSSGALFPIGQSATSYDPVTIKPAATQSFGAKVGLQTTTIGTSPMNPAAVVDREWDITGTAGTVDLTFVTAALTKTSANPRPSIGDTIVIGHYSGGVWQGFKSIYATANTWTTTGYTGTFSPFLVAGTLAVLAVDLTSLAVKSTGNVNIVNWATASEKNNASFDVQHATNGRDFRTIGTVKGNGTTNAASNYAFEHATPSVGTNYYRLNQIDANGAATLSKVVSVQFGGKKGDLKVFPSLAYDKVTVLTNSDQAQDFSISNLLGQTVLTGRLTNATDVNINQLAKGVYILKVAGETVKFSKQ